MTQKEKEQFESLQQENENLRDELARLRDTTETAFMASTTYHRMQDELTFERNLRASVEDNAAFWKGKYEELQAMQNPVPVSEQEAKIAKLIELNAELQQRLRFQQAVIDGTQPENPKSSTAGIGRPKEISDPVRKEMRRYRRSGYSFREIADITGYSVGAVHGICSSVKVDPETIKQHRKAKKGKK